MLGIIKGDVRYTYLSQIVEYSILSNRLEDFYGVDELILPLGGIDKDYHIKQSNLNIKDILNLTSIRRIYTGNANNELKELCNQHHILLFEMLNDETFVKENAFLTAKGLLYFIHRGVNELADQRVLLLGYGNISFYLAKLLKALQVKFEIYTENETERKFARLEGYKICDKLSANYDVWINTIPKNIDMDYGLLKNKRIIDVASAPYGFSIDEVNRYDLDYEIMAAIPSKFAPASAARIIKKFIENNRR